MFNLPTKIVCNFIKLVHLTYTGEESSDFVIQSDYLNIEHIHFIKEK